MSDHNARVSDVISGRALDVAATQIFANIADGVVLTDENRYIGLEQEKASARDLVDTYAEGAEEAGTLDIDGVVWQRFDGPDRSITLVQETAEVTTLVTTSTAPLEDVETFVRRLATA